VSFRKQRPFCLKCGQDLLNKDLERGICPKCNSDLKKMGLNPPIQPSGATPQTPKDMIQEYKRTCAQCGKIWYSLVSREEEVKRLLGEEVVMEGAELCNCCFWAWPQRDRNYASLREQLNDLRRCPSCHSSNYTEEIISHEKK